MKIHLNNVRISFANGLFKASSTVEGGPLKYGADFLLTPGHEVYIVNPDGSKKKSTMKDVELAVATETWKANGAKMLASLEASKRAHRDGDQRMKKDGTPYEGYEGLWYVTAKNTARPLVIDADKTPLTEADGKPYSGCYVNAIIEVYGNAAPTKKGVFAALKGVQFVRDGDAFGGGGRASEDEFDAVEGAEASDFA